MMTKKTVKLAIYFGLGIACVPLILSMMLAISGFMVYTIAVAILSMLGSIIGVTGIFIAIISLFIGFFLLWIKLSRAGIRTARNASRKALDITKEQAHEKRYFEEVWISLCGLVMVMSGFYIFSYYFFDGLRPGPPEPGSIGLSRQAINSISTAYKECAVQFARGVNNRGLSYPSFTKSKVDNYKFIPEDGSCAGDELMNITAKSNDEELNPSFSINTSTGYKSCHYKGKDQEDHKCIDRTW